MINDERVTANLDKHRRVIIADKYRLKRKLGSGSFGDIYQAYDIYNKSKTVAIKLEAANVRNPMVLYEAKVLASLQPSRSSPFVGIPRLCPPEYGSDHRFNYMVMELLGPSLEDLFDHCDRKFSLKTVAMLADAMISRIEYLHRNHYIHRDIKPENFLMGCGRNKNQVYIIDFGLAKKYMSDRKHIPFVENKNLVGTARYASINAHNGRRDDLENLGYVLLYFCRGIDGLPWMGLRSFSRKQKYEKIREMKMNTRVSDLCHGLPNEFATFLYKVRGYRFEDQPDYDYLKQLFKRMLINLNEKFDYQYDWVTRKRKRSNSADIVETKAAKKLTIVLS